MENREHTWERHAEKFALICANCNRIWYPDESEPKDPCK